VAGTMPPGESCAERLADAEHRHGTELTEHFASLREQNNG
jgi:hypothetical protein